MKAGKGSRPAPAERLSFRRGTAPLAGPFPFDPSRWQEVPWPRSHLTSSRDLVVTDQTPREPPRSWLGGAIRRQARGSPQKGAAGVRVRGAAPEPDFRTVFSHSN